MNEKEEKDIRTKMNIERKKELFENVDDDGNIEIEKKLLTTSDQKNELWEPESPKKLDILTTNQLDGLKLKKPDDLKFIMTNADLLKSREIKNLRKKIEGRIEALPKQIYLKCDNPACKWKGKMYFNRHRKQDGQPCLWCNWQNYKTGGFLHEMSKSEAAEWERQEADRQRIINERIRKSMFYKTNQRRQESGLEPLSYEQFEKELEENNKKELEQYREMIKLNQKAIDRRNKNE